MLCSAKSVMWFFYSLAILFLSAYIIVTFKQQYTLSGWFLMLSLLSTAVAFREHPFLKGFSFPLIIAAGVSVALYYPYYFVMMGGFKLSGLIVPLLQLIMFGMGTELSLNDFKEVLKMPKGVLTGIICHYTIMPLVGALLAAVFHFPPEIAAGMILVGCCPSGVASNVMCYLARANLALSVSVTIVSTLLAPFLTPLLMRWLGGSYIEVHWQAMIWDISKIVLLPVVGGLLFHYLIRGKFSWLDRVLPLISMAGITLIIVVITAAGRDSLLKVGGWLVLATFLHNITGFFLGYWAGRLFKFPEKDCRTISLEVGMQNSGLASGLALTMGKLATVGLAPAVFGPLMNTNGSILSSWWHRRLPDPELMEDDPALILEAD